MRVLVTGGAGFIGGHLAEAFAGEGHDVVVLDAFVPYYDTRIKEYNAEQAREAANTGNGSYELLRGDVRDEEIVAELIESTDIVFHQAAQAGVRTSVEQPRTVHDINVTGTLNVLEGARDAEVERIVLASSSSVYGKPQYLPYDEDHPTTPISPYGASKLAGEQYGRVYHEVYGMPVVSLRYFTVYGPRMRPNMAISNFVSRCMNGEAPIVYGEGTQTRDFTYVDDIVEANRTLFTSDAADGEVINVGSTDRIEIRELAEVVRDAIDPSLELKFADRHPADAKHTHSDISKAQELIDYEPTMSIREGIERFIGWYQENRDWYEAFVMAS